jgi:hypothetical protein
MIDRWTACLRFLRGQEWAQLFPVFVGEHGQMWQPDWHWKLRLSQGRLTRAAFHMAVPGPCLMHASKVRPPQPLHAQFLWLLERLDQPAQFGHTQPETCLTASAFFSWALA